MEIYDELYYYRYALDKLKMQEKEKYKLMWAIANWRTLGYINEKQEKELQRYSREEIRK